MPWFARYVRKLRSALIITPSTRVLTDLNLSYPYLVEAQLHCTFCAPSFRKDLKRFHEIFAEVIIDRVASVSSVTCSHLSTLAYHGVRSRFPSNDLLSASWSPAPAPVPCSPVLVSCSRAWSLMVSRFKFTQGVEAGRARSSSQERPQPCLCAVAMPKLGSYSVWHMIRKRPVGIQGRTH